MLFELNQEAPDRTSIQLDEITGELLRSLLVRQSGMSWARYLERVEIAPQNAANYLSGRNRISLSVLNKLISGTDLCLHCNLNVQITKENGSDAADATCMSPEEMLSGIDLDYPSREELDGLVLMSYNHPSTPQFFLSETPLIDKKIILDSLSRELAEES